MNKRLLLCFAVGLLAGGGLRAQAPPPSALPSTAPAPTAPALKAAFLVNFARYTEWPADALRTDEIAACIVGRDPTVLAAAAISGKSIGARVLALRRAFGPEDLGGCQLVFIAASEERRMPALLAALYGQPVLTVSDTPGFIDMGGVIGLLDAGDRFEFEVNFAAAQGAGIKLSSQMLRLARRVLGRPR